MKRKSVFIIAEIGINHNGRIKNAFNLIKKAKFCGADAVKFQSFIPEQVVTKNLGLASYQKTNIKKNRSSMLGMLHKYKISFKNQFRLFEECRKNKIQFISSAFDLESLSFLINGLKLKTLKIPSGEITNFPYLVKIAKSKKKLILSTGMSTTKEISQAINVLIKYGAKKKKINLLHCNSSYPTPIEDVNLNAINFLKKKFKLNVGLSDHTNSTIIPAAAVAAGANIIEKHFTLNTNQDGPDHKSSLDPIKFKNMVLNIRQVERAIGKENKSITLSEKNNQKFSRKSIVAKKKIKKGEKFSLDNLTTKRPGNGISPMNWNKILSQKSTKNLNKDDLIK